MSKTQKLKNKVNERRDGRNGKMNKRQQEGKGGEREERGKGRGEIGREREIKEGR